MAKDTKDIILDAAKTLFSIKGFAGCNVDLIAEKAKVNKATIYYHYKNKSTLYEKVLEVNLERFLQHIQKAIQQYDSPIQKLEAFTHTYASNFTGNRLMAPIMLRELASDGEHLTGTTRKIIKEILSVVDTILEEGQKCGLFRETKSFLPYFMIVGSMNIYTSTPKMRKKFHNQEMDFGFSATADEVAEEITKIILSGIKI